MATLEEVKARRKELRSKRRYIFNDDGAAISYYRKEYGDPVDASAFLAYQFGPHRGVGNHVVANPEPSDINTFVFNTGKSGFVLHNSSIKNMSIGSPYGDDISISDPGDATQALINNTGKDALQVAGEFFENEPVDFFFEMRVNDRHDASFDRADLVELKKQLWDSGGLIKNGVNNGLDFASLDSYNLTLDTITEVVNSPSYKINGVCLNFYRHFGTFKNVTGEDAQNPVTQTQIDIMTGLVQDVNNAMNAVSQSLMDAGKEPLLLMVKIADHPGFNKAVALDVDDWFDKDLVDIMVPMGYHQFSHIRDSVAWGHRKGVSVVPSVQDSRVDGRRLRHTESGLRGRILQVLGSGSDGVEFFNWNYGKDPSYRGQSGIMWRSLSKDKLLSWGDGSRVYYVTWTNQAGGNIGTAGQLPVERFFPQYMDWVSEDRPWADGEGSLPIEIYEEPEDVTTATLNFYMEGAMNNAAFNGAGLTLVAESYGYSADIAPYDMVKGINKIQVFPSEGARILDIEVQVS